MKRLLTILLAGLLIVAVTAPAIAWEFNMKGEWEYRFRYFGRTGDQDLLGQQLGIAEIGFAGQNIYGHQAAIVNVFGPGAAQNLPPFTTTASTFNPQFVAGGNPYATTAAGNTGVLANVNSTSAKAGMAIIRGGFSQYGSDALYHDSRLTLYPEIRVNPAIRVHGVYTVGGLRNKYAEHANYLGAGVTSPFLTGVGVPPYERYYVHQTSDNAYDTAAIGSWEQFRATIQVPWGVLSLGVKDFPFGTGASLSNGLRSEAALLVVPYGPMRILWGVWLARSVTGDGWGTEPDGDRKPSFFEGMLATYDAADLSAGLGYIQRNTHVKGPFNINPTALTGINIVATPRADALSNQAFDQNLMFWLAYMKYNNGRFFFNAEYAFFNLDTYFVPSRDANGLLRQGRTPTFGEGYHWFTEFGAMAGPAKVSLMNAISSGPVLNNENPTKAYTPYPIDYQAMAPYQFLMFETYGGGNDTFSGLLLPADGHGMMGDAFCYAGRLDYAVASNLNVWGSYIWAHRLEKQGYLFGGKSSFGAPGSLGPNGTIAAFANEAQRAASSRFIGGGANYDGGYLPTTSGTRGYVTDGFIGWEANAGVDWKLLEGMTAYFRYSYWQPGDWFKEAYQAQVMGPNGALTTTGVLNSRDAIQAFHGSLMINF